MSESQSNLWDRILQVNRELKETQDVLVKWEKQILMRVLVLQFKKEMGEEKYRDFLDSSRQLLAH
jgi:hypothetical protein